MTYDNSQVQKKKVFVILIIISCPLGVVVSYDSCCDVNL